jgi:murein DD-endopeptidase MepM/ murein hydrolase activator NlpD
MRRASATGVLAPFAGALTLATVVVVAGCSADVTRFSLGSTFTTGDTGLFPFTPTKTSAHGPGSAYAPPKGLAHTPPPTETVLSPLKPPSKEYRVVGRNYDPPPTTPPPHVPPPPATAKQPPAAKEPPPEPASAIVEVQPGDTLYGIARRYGVTASAVKELNDLSSMVVRPGQRLVLPAEAKEAKERGPLATAGPSGKAAPPTGEATGAKLSGAKEPPVGTGDPPPGPPRVVQVKPRIIKADEGLTAGAKEKTAKRGDMATDALPPRAAITSGKFRWPLRGKVIVGFGAQSDGSKNDGINLAAPLGTDVHAAEAGRVHYVGDGLKGYGKLVLIRHGDDWATAYGYVDQIQVKINDEVKRGQVIAKVGKSGPVTQPQLKFELRKASVPVDPLGHLAN